MIQSVVRLERRLYLCAAAESWPLASGLEACRATGEQLPLQPAPLTQSFWEELAGATAVYV